MKTDRDQSTDSGAPERENEVKAYSRRDFLRIAGLAGAVVGVGGGLGGLLAGCGGSSTTTSASQPATTASSAVSTTATTSGESTTVSSAAETGREVKVGVIIPVTGYLALFGVSDKWALNLVNKYLGDSFLLGDGKMHKVTWLLTDTQSDSNRASQVTSDLFLNEKVDIACVAGGPDTVNPSADMAESIGLPLLMVNNIWEAFIFGRGGQIDTVYKWVWGQFLGVDQCVQASLQVADKISTNKVAGLLESNTADGQAWLTPGTGFPDVFKQGGYTVVYPGPYNPGTEDYTSLISAYKQAGCEIHIGSNPGTDFPNYWKQALQQSYHPKMAVEIVSVSNYEDLKALGDIAVGLTVGFTWHADWPFKDDIITGMTNAELAADYEASQNTKWSNMITPYSRIQWTVDVLRRSTNLDDKNSIVDAIKATKTTLTNGPIDLTTPANPATLHVTPNVHKQVLCLGQVVKATSGKWLFDVPLVAAIDAPSGITTIDPVPIQYS
ncbi:MAG: ABC transporter substrate-binding protein [Actinobacteria bacterium]|nr:ABC transporter substrate-binding protein [Actinomycetota bacterium]